MSREDFIMGVYALDQIKWGWMNEPWHDDYLAGYLNAVTFWISGAYEKSYHLPSTDFDARAGFRLVVEGRDSIADNSDEFIRGYASALVMFQAAKGL